MASSHAQEEEGIANEKATNEPLLSYAERYSTSSLDSEDDAIGDEVLLDSDLPEVRDGAEAEAADPFLSFDDLPDEDRNILTFRAILVGLLCGGLVNASNIYLGLKSGWTSGANIFGVQGIIGPILVNNGIAFGQPAVPNDQTWDGLMSYSSLSDEFASANHPSPRYWLLWPGITCMIAVSFTELACQWRIFILSGKVLYRGTLRVWARVTNRKGRASFTEKYDDEDNNKTIDPASRDEQVATWMWLPGLIVVLVMACVVMKSQFGMPVGEILLALFLAFFFSFLAIQSTGATDITPLTAASKASQIILGATTSGQGWTLQQAQRLNLIGGALASIGANQAADLTGDFRVGFLLRTSPKLQWFAQSIGTFVAVFLAPSIFVLFATAYPCILDASPDTCPFAAPSVSAWRAVAIAVTSSDFVIPSSSKWFSILFAVFGVFMVLLRHCVWTGRWEWVRTYHPNMMIISLAFLLPSTVYGTAMFIGAGLAWAWNKKSPQSYAIFGSAVAAGFMAGEGIGGVINAAMTVMGVDFDKIGTSFLCPGDKC
ncbi:hypothetical protein ACLOAV_004918 [Pseudogymnoascus australis]